MNTVSYLQFSRNYSKIYDTVRTEFLHDAPPSTFYVQFGSDLENYSKNKKNTLTTYGTGRGCAAEKEGINFILLSSYLKHIFL